VSRSIIPLTGGRKKASFLVGMHNPELRELTNTARFQEKLALH